MDESSRVVVHAVTWNSSSYIPNLLASLVEQTVSGVGIVIVDNASSDGTVAVIQQQCPDAMVLRNIRNHGRCRAHNQAITWAVSHWPEQNLAGCYILIVSPEVECDPDAIRQLVAYMDAHPDVGVCMPKILRAVTKSAHEDRRETERTTILDSTGIYLTKSRSRRERGSGEEDRGQYDTSSEIFGCSTACALFRASVVVQCRGGEQFFDEDLFEQEEDVDVAWRLRRFGIEARYVPQAVVWRHVPAMSSPRTSPIVNFYAARNHGWVRCLHEEAVNAIVHAPWIVTRAFIDAWKCLVSWSRLKGCLASWAGAPRMIKKRFVVARQVRIRGAHIRRWFL